MNSDIYSTLKSLKLKYFNKIVIAHLNINSLRNKFDLLSDIVKDNIDILLISETKIDESFPISAFLLPGFSPPIRRDRNANGGGVLLYIRSDIPSRELHDIPIPNDIECIFTEINLHKKKWLLISGYNPSKNLINRMLQFLGAGLEHYLPLYDNVILIGDFNSEVIEFSMSQFCETFNLKNLVKEPTCFKNPINPSCIDLILTNRFRSFNNTLAIETGLSDCHKMVLTILNTTYKKSRPKIISYRDYKQFCNTKFTTDLLSNFSNHDLNNIDYDVFETVFLQVLNRHAPMKFKYLRANDSPFMNKVLRKSIMLRSKLKNKFNLEKTEVARKKYIKQRNTCTNLLRAAKRNYYDKLNPSVISDNRLFWKRVKPLFSDKSVLNDNITLINDKNIISDDYKIAEIFNDFFSNVVTNLKRNIDPKYISDTKHVEDPVLIAIEKYKTHPSILKIKETCVDESQFSFTFISLQDMQKHIMDNKSSKSCSIDSIPSVILKENLDMVSLILYNNFNNSLYSCVFPDKLKLANIIPSHKSGNRTSKENYRPISNLPDISKIYERLLYFQLNNYFDNKLSKFQCGFRKGFSPQNCLVVMVEKWKKSMDKKCSAGALLTDLSKAFDSIAHDLLIAKLNAYGVDFNSLELINSYLSNRYQRVKVNSKYSSWSVIKCGVPQGSILGPLLFNIYLCDLFFYNILSTFANYADDNTPYITAQNIETVIQILETDSHFLFKWLSFNILIPNPSKSHLLLNNPSLELFALIDGKQIFNSNREKLLGILIDNELTFSDHVTKLCSKASQKLHALSRVAHYMSIEQRRIIMKAFIQAQFGYCPLVWMCHSRSLNNRINKIHERSLRLVYNDHGSTFSELLIKDGSFTVHEKNIQTLSIEVFKVVHKISPEIMNEVFPLKKILKYNSKNIFETTNVRTVFCGTETASFLGPKIWNIIPNDIKQAATLQEFKRKIRNWKPTNCPCRLCKAYVSGVGFVNIT